MKMEKQTGTKSENKTRIELKHEKERD